MFRVPPCKGNQVLRNPIPQLLDQMCVEARRVVVEQIGDMPFRGPLRILRRQRRQRELRQFIVRLDLEDLAEARRRLVQLASAFQRKTEVVPSQQQLGLQGKGLAITGDGIVIVALVRQYQSQVIVRLGVIRLERKGLLVACPRVAAIARGAIRFTQVAVRVRIGRFGRGGLFVAGDRAANVIDGLPITPGLVRDGAEQVERVGVCRVDAQHLSVDRFCFGQASRPVVCDARRDRFRNFGRSEPFRRRIHSRVNGAPVRRAPCRGTRSTTSRCT